MGSHGFEGLLVLLSEFFLRGCDDGGGSHVHGSGVHLNVFVFLFGEGANSFHCHSLPDRFDLIPYRLMKAAVLGAKDGRNG